MQKIFIRAIEQTSQTKDTLLYQTPNLLLGTFLALIVLLIIGGLFCLTLFFVLTAPCKIITFLIILTGIIGLLITNKRDIEFDKNTGKVLIRDTMPILRKKSFKAYSIKNITQFEITEKDIIPLRRLMGKTITRYIINMIINGETVELGADFHRQYAQWKIDAIEEFLWGKKDKNKDQFKDLEID